jgi:hypothetical protein
MTFNLTVYGWMIPLAITVVSLAVALTIEKPTGSYGDGLQTVFALIPALGISCIAWIMYALFK